MLNYKECTKMAKLSAMNDGYNHVIIKNKDDGNYSHSREYDGCCPSWYGNIVARILTYWESGMLKIKLELLK